MWDDADAETADGADWDADGGPDAEDQDADAWEPPAGPSKSQVKREHHALQQLAARLTTLPRAELLRLRLSEATWAALDETPRIKDVRARGRHYKRIANLLVREDMHAVTALMDEAESRERAERARHHGLERWRERLIGEGDAAVGDFLDDYPQTDRQQLRALVRAASRDVGRGRPESARRLFRFLREAVDAAADEGLEHDGVADDDGAPPDDAD